MTAIIKIFSMSASIKVPRVDVTLYFLAKCSFNQSVMPQKMKRIMLKLALPAKSMCNNNTMKNSKGIRSNLAQFAKFIEGEMKAEKKIAATQNLNFLLVP
jgi:hypothetical protein